MRQVTLLSLAQVQDPLVRAALQQIQDASADNIINDVAQSGAALATIKDAAADTAPYYTSPTTVAVTALTAFGRTVMACINAAALLALLPIDFSTLMQRANNLNDVASVPAARTNLGLGTAATHNDTEYAHVSQVDFLSGGVKLPANQDYHIIEKIPFGCTLTSFTAKLISGTCVATLKINTTGVTGGAIAVTSVQQTVTPSAANVMAANDTLDLTVAAVASASDLSFTVVFTRTLT